MDLPRSASISMMFNDDNEDTDRFAFVNFDNSNEDDEHNTFEMLLLPERGKSATFAVTNIAKLSPIMSPTFTSTPTTITTGINTICVTMLRNVCSEEVVADVSPTRVALNTIHDFVESTVVLRKDKNNELGISIIGGNDTYFESICVLEVHGNSAADRDGRLRCGDLILAVNDRSLRDVSFADALQVLKDASSPLRLIILRENAQHLFTTHQCPTKFITVELRKGSIKDKLGLSIMQRTNARGVFITYVPSSIASKHGRLIQQGDQILEINGQNVRESNQKEVANVIMNMDGAIVLLLGRVPSLTNSIHEWGRTKASLCLRARTSTWSTSEANNCKEKLRDQRPSLPVNAEKSYFQVNSLSPETEMCVNVMSPFSPFITNSISDHDLQSGIASRTSSIRSRCRLSIVAEDFKNRESLEGEDNGDGVANEQSFENSLLPSIKVTEF